MVPATALVVASNCPSGYFGPDVHDAYYRHPSGMGWLAPLMFADGAGAVVFRSAPHDPGSRPKGLLSVRYETNPDVELVMYPAGGCLHHTSAASTLILLDEDRRAGRVRDGALVAFLWIGAGNGAMNGYAAMML